MRDQLQRVLLLVDAAELLQEALDQRAAVLLETRAQGLQPGVQSPGNPCGRGTCEVERVKTTASRGSPTSSHLRLRVLDPFKVKCV